MTTRRVPAAAVLADPAATAGDLVGPVAFVCNRGVIAQSVSHAFRAEGVDATGLEVRHARLDPGAALCPVDLGTPVLDVLLVQRPGRGCLSDVIASDARALVVDQAPDADVYGALAAELGARITDIVDTTCTPNTAPARVPWPP